MSSRASSQAFKALAAGSKQIRSLHMTGPATFSSLLTSERPALNLPRDAAGLRAECQKRKLPTTGSISELTARLSAHEITNTRAFSSAVQESKRPIPDPASVGKPVRHFNTSRSLKAVGDTSTIDFAYLPDFDPDSAQSPVVRVPILPQTIASESTKANTAADVDEEVLLPSIVTVAADGTHIHTPSAMSDVHDNGDIDFQGMAAMVAEKTANKVEEGAGMMKQVWGGLMDDLFGPKTNGPARS